MGKTVTSLPVRGLRTAHFSQIVDTLIAGNVMGTYFTNKADHDKRYREILDWLEPILEQLEDGSLVIRAKKEGKS